MKVRSVVVDGRETAPSETDGYYAQEDNCSTFIVVVLPKIARGSHEIDIHMAD
ncbi:MAG: hypothetical protein ACE15C_21880 [Phycisphaerae bacterium]